MYRLRIVGVTLSLLLVAVDSQAKEWRGIVPLKTSSGDVERMLGKENAHGRYQFEGERAYIFYSSPGGGGIDQTPLTRQCEELIPEGIVVSIHVYLEVSRKFSTVGADLKRFEKQPISHGMDTYSSLTEGVIYTVNRSDDVIDSITCLPSEVDCKALLKRKDARSIRPLPAPAPTPRYTPEPILGNSWHGFRPLFSSRAAVERELGPAQFVIGSVHTYKKDKEAFTITFHYVDAKCGSPGALWNVPFDTVKRIEINPLSAVLLKDLNLELSKYEKVESRILRTGFTTGTPKRGFSSRLSFVTNARRS